MEHNYTIFGIFNFNKLDVIKINTTWSRKVQLFYEFIQSFIVKSGNKTSLNWVPGPAVGVNLWTPVSSQLLAILFCAVTLILCSQIFEDTWVQCKLNLWHCYLTEVEVLEHGELQQDLTAMGKLQGKHQGWSSKQSGNQMWKEITLKQLSALSSVRHSNPLLSFFCVVVVRCGLCRRWDNVFMCLSPVSSAHRHGLSSPSLGLKLVWWFLPC